MINNDYDNHINNVSRFIPSLTPTMRRFTCKYTN